MPVAPIGSLLRDTRTARNMSIEDVAWRLRIRPEILRALEDEDFASLGHHGFVRTHLRSYAKVLGLDTGDVLRTYRKLHEPKGAPTPLEALDEQDRVARKHRPRPRWMLAACLAAALLIAGSLAGFMRSQGTKPVAQPSKLPAGPRLIEQASRALSPAKTEQVVVRIAADRATQVLVTVDGKRTFEGVLAPGASQLYSGARTIDVEVADMKAVAIWANDVRVTPVSSGAWRGTFGRFGLVR